MELREAKDGDFMVHGALEGGGDDLHATVNGGDEEVDVSTGVICCVNAANGRDHLLCYPVELLLGAQQLGDAVKSERRDADVEFFAAFLSL
jgi:hypothetical protein